MHRPVCYSCVYKTHMWFPYYTRSRCSHVRARINGEALFPCMQCDEFPEGVPYCDFCTIRRPTTCSRCGKTIPCPPKRRRRQRLIIPLEFCEECVGKMAKVLNEFKDICRGRIGGVPFPCRRCDQIGAGVDACDGCYVPLEFIYTRHRCAKCKNEISPLFKM